MHTGLPCTGIYPGVSNETYHRQWVHAENKSGLYKLLDCPARYKHHKDNPPETTNAMIIGTATHVLTYEPENFDRECVIEPEFNKRTKDGREDAAAFALANMDKRIISRADYETAKNLADAVRADPYAAAELAGCQAETSIIFEDTETKILCKIRPDGWRTGAGGVINDLKTTQSLEHFHYDCIKYGYFFQAAFYRWGVWLATGELLPFRFIAVEKTAPYLVRIFEPSENALRLGLESVKDCLRLLKKCRENNSYPGYVAGVELLDVESLPTADVKKYSEFFGG